jgi:hypothetical protein
MPLPQEQVLEIYCKNRPIFFENNEINSQARCVAYLLGGQPACGKSGLIKSIKSRFTDFFVINGDEYRQYHPNSQNLIRQSNIYSQETQNFSNIFTENLILDASNAHFNMIIEGTMRNPSVPISTAKLLHKKNYKVGIAVIASHPKITELGVYRRYAEQLNAFGVGRLADIKSHNEACLGLLKSVDLLYNDKIVDFIEIYSYLGKKKIASYDLIDGNWNNSILPSVIIEKEQKEQISNKTTIKNHIELGLKSLQLITNEDIKNSAKQVISELKSLLTTPKIRL